MCTHPHCRYGKRLSHADQQLLHKAYALRSFERADGQPGEVDPAELQVGGERGDAGVGMGVGVVRLLHCNTAPRSRLTARRPTKGLRARERSPTLGHRVLLWVC